MPVPTFKPFSAALIIAGSIAASISGCAAHHSARHEIAAAVFAPARGAPTEFFSFQFVLKDNGAPVQGPVSFKIDLVDDQDSVLTTTILEGQSPAEGGRFDLMVQLPQDPDELLAPDFVAVRVFIDGSEFPLAPDMEVKYSPMAWAAERARTAEFADSASSASFASSAGTASNATNAVNADFADEAGQLTGDMTVNLVPNTTDGWSNYGFGYEDIKATRVGGMVFLSGLADGPNSGLSIITTLPEGFRPSARHIVYVDSQISPLRLDVLPDGRIFQQLGQHQGFVSLTGISFPAAP